MAGITKKKKRLTLTGRLTIENAQKTHKEIEAFLEKPFSSEIYLPGIEETDISFIQILYSVMLTAKKTGKEIFFLTDDQTKMEKIIVNTGFQSHFSVKVNEDRNNYLIEGITNGANIY